MEWGCRNLDADLSERPIVPELIPRAAGIPLLGRFVGAVTNIDAEGAEAKRPLFHRQYLENVLSRSPRPWRR